MRAGLVIALTVVLGTGALGVGVAPALGQGPQPGAPIGVPAGHQVLTLSGASELAKLGTTSGFIDDIVATDADRVAYVVTDGATKAELHVVTLATKADQVIDLSTITMNPISITLVGQRALIVGRVDENQQIAAMVELAATSKTKPAGTVAYRVGPAFQISVIARDGKQRIAVYKGTLKVGAIVHKVELLAIETGKKVATSKPLELDLQAKHKQLDFQVNHWSQGYTRAHGVKGGEWDKKEDERSPNVEAVYDLITGKFIERTKIADLYEQRRRFEVLHASTHYKDFVRSDNTGLQLWVGGKPRTLELDQALTNYDVKSLQAVVNGDGSAWIAIKIDPVNAAAVARKKADPEYLDIFRLDAGATKAIRKARIPASKARHWFGLHKTGFWLIERNAGFERGGKSLVLYTL
jgi:hypothetical protein